MSNLVELARKSIETYFDKKELDLTPYKQYNQVKGAFVTLRRLDRLRGCIGIIEAKYPLYKSIYEMSRFAAFDDERFQPLKKHELKDLEIEVSVLTKPEKIIVDSYHEYKHKIKLGVDGIILGRGVFLPSVPIEMNWDVETYLTELAKKADLPATAWQKMDVYKFQVKTYK